MTLTELELVNGDQCSQLWGTAAGIVDRVALNYGCTSPSGSGFYDGGLDTSSPLWTTKIAPRCVALPTYSCTGPLITADVTHAWI
jgi:hypothetical protein